MAAITVATAFCGCTDKNEEIIPLGEADVSKEELALRERSATERSAETKGLSETKDRPEAKEGPTVTIYVCGAVNNPDVYTLSDSLRLIDAVEAAGGFTADACIDMLNLASKISDGQKLYIPTKDEVKKAMEEDPGLYGTVVNITTNDLGRGVTDRQPQADNPADMVNINSADAITLMTLPGIGQAKAEKIIAYRQENGGFSCIEDLMLVAGIKEGLFNKVKDRICVR